MNNHAPPPVINSARLLAYALNDKDVKFTNRLKLFVGEKRMGEAPRLAICESLNAERQVLLFFCDEQWQVLGVIASPSVADAKRQAEIGYEGISTKWVSCDTSVKDAESYLESFRIKLESAFDKGKCTFCKKLSREVGRLYGNEEALICDECIEEFYKYVQEDLKK